MKRLMTFAMGTAFCLALHASALANELLPGQVDFGTFTPPKGGGQFVEVNVPSSLISLAARLVEKDEPDLAKLLNGLKLVRVNVISLDEDNRADIEKRVKKIHKELQGKTWERIVTAQEKDQDVGIYVKMSKEGGVEGLVVMVTEGKEQAVFVNVVGEIKPEQISMLGEKLQLDPLKKIGIGNQKEKSTDDSDKKAEDEP